MKQLLIFMIVLLPHMALGQANTEVYLFDLSIEKDQVTLSNPKNISNNEGYDNQPSFLNDNTVLFTSTRAGQTDILQFNVTEGSTTEWITDTPMGSEYSPLKIPGKNAVSAIRLDLNGLQRLYQYDIETGEPSLLLEDLKIGYHVWYNDSIVVASVLKENRMDLVASNIADGTTKTLQKNVGRSFHKIPNSDLVSYISKENKPWEIKSIDPLAGTTDKIATVYKNSEDICWLPDGSILTGSDKTILRLDTSSDGEWQPIITFEVDEINDITRIAVNNASDRLAFVAEQSPVEIIEKQVQFFNDRNLEGFVSCYSDDVLVQRFPNETMYTGSEKMTENYARFFENTKDSKVKVIKRIRIGNKVIDEEMAEVDGRTNQQVAIYEVENSKIASMTFIFQDAPITDAEAVVQQQLDAYNDRDIDAFINTYAYNIKLYNFSSTLISEGKESMRANYAGFFESTPDLHCEIKNRIVIGNKVIDEEYITANGGNFSAVAIYEVENGKIAKVTFLR